MTLGSASRQRSTQPTSPTEGPEAALVVSELQVSYGLEHAVDGLSFTVGRGEFVALLGPSGSGKTTTLRAIAGFEPVSSGSIEIDGRTVGSRTSRVPTEKRPINMVFQSYAVWPHLNVFDNVAYGLRPQKVPREEVTERVSEMLATVGMAQYTDRHATELSGGQQQRVALARALVTRPLIMLYDEPLSNLDASLRAQVREQILELHERFGTSTLYVTHDQSEALSMADKVIVMRDGHAAQMGTPFELYTKPTDSFVARFLGSANIATARPQHVDAGTTTVSLNEEPAVSIVIANDSRPSTAERSAETGEVAIRPEHFRIRPTGQIAPSRAVNAWTGQVSRVRYFGSRVECIVSVGGWEVAVEAPGDVRLEAGAPVELSVEPGHPVWLPEGGA